MRVKPVKYLVIGDVHLGNERNRAPNIIKNLDNYMDWYSDKSPMAKLQAIFIAGDLLDRLLNFASSDVHEIMLWLGRMMRFCARHKIVLRILEGTPLHDRKQSKVADVVYDFLGLELDFRYIDVLHIEYIESLDLRVLYVPDEWHADTSETFRQVKDLLKEENLEQVDIAIMHGAFRYQLPMAPDTVPKHNEEDYLGVVKHYIHIGHVHIFSVYSRILAEGSFDRIAHGEEKPKGGVVATLGKDQDSFDFVENKMAKIFKTIELASNDLEKCMAKINKELAKVPDDSYVRIKAVKDHPVLVAFDELKLKYPMYTFEKAREKDDADDYQLISNVTLDKSYTPIHINKDNIVKLVKEAVVTKYNLSSAQLEILDQTLESINAQ